jgi:hypothetical protein
LCALDALRVVVCAFGGALGSCQHLLLGVVCPSHGSDPHGRAVVM